jgi:DNA-binding NarL/FixJ family response regulator
VAVLTDACDAGMIVSLRELDISRIVLKPFKVKTILETISQLMARPN